jgi:hypothetical protein
MKQASFLLIIVLVAACTVFAQSSKTDPISGTWSGYMGPGASPQFAVSLELKYDGKLISGTVSGLPSPGEVKAGSFDPSTGFLKLEASPVNDSTTRLVLEGTVVMDTVTGRVTVPNQTGTFKFTKQGSPTNDLAPALKFGFNEVSAWITKAADMVPADKYNYRPVQTVRTFGQQIAHVVDSYNYFCSRATNPKVEWSDATEKGSTDKAILIQKLKQATDACTAAYGSEAKAPPLMANIAHTNLHYGNLITYLRMMGMTPPSS